MQNLSSWREDLVSVNDAMQWLKSNIEDCKIVEGPLDVYRSNEWGMTSSFEVTVPTGIRQVVLKIGFLPLFRTSPAIYRSLATLNSDQVITYRFGQVRGTQTWLLFDVFQGVPVREINQLSVVCCMAQTMAKLQLDFMRLDEVSKIGIPTYEATSTLRAVMEQFIHHAMEKFAPVWFNNADQISKHYNVSFDDLNRISNLANLSKMVERSRDICDELSRLGSLQSIYHLDFHTNNAVLTTEGCILIYDFEESVIAHPFFVLQKLIDEVVQFDGELRNEADAAHWSPAQRKLRDRYLEVFEGIGHTAKLRMFDLAMTVAPLFYAYLSETFLQQVGWHESTPGLMAQSFIASESRMRSLL